MGVPIADTFVLGSFHRDYKGRKEKFNVSADLGFYGIFGRLLPQEFFNLLFFTTVAVFMFTKFLSNYQNGMVT